MIDLCVKVFGDESRAFWPQELRRLVRRRGQDMTMPDLEHEH